MFLIYLFPTKKRVVNVPKLFLAISMCSIFQPHICSRPPNYYFGGGKIVMAHILVWDTAGNNLIENLIFLIAFTALLSSSLYRRSVSTSLRRKMGSSYYYPRATKMMITQHRQMKGETNFSYYCNRQYRPSLGIFLIYMKFISNLLLKGKTFAIAVAYLMHKFSSYYTH